MQLLQRLQPRPCRRVLLASALFALVACAAPRSENVSDPEPPTPPEGQSRPAAADAPAGPAPTEVVVMGMLHGKHVRNRFYSLGTIKDMIRSIEPDYVLTEIPPDRLERSLRDFREEGIVNDPRVGRFPEYYDALFPLTREMDFEIVACAAWTRPMADERTRKLRELRQMRPEADAEVQAAFKRMEQTLVRESLANDWRKVHTERYDEVTRAGMEPYGRLYDAELGAGGWTAINEAHFALMRKAIEEHRGEGGKRFLITFGAGHKYWILDALKEMDGVVVRNPLEFHPPQGRSADQDS